MTGFEAIGAIDYVILPCANIEAARTFYREVMRFTLVEDRPDWVRFRVGASYLTLRPRGQWLCWNDGAMLPGTAAIQLAFRMTPAQVDQCHAELIARGIEIVDPPKTQDFGHRTLFFRDTESNIIEVFAEIQVPPR